MKKHEFILHANVHCSIYKYCIFEIPEPINVLYAIKKISEGKTVYILDYMATWDTI